MNNKNRRDRLPIGVDVTGAIRYRKSKKNKVITNGIVSISRAK